MKKIILVISILCVVLSISSCKKNTDNVPEGLSEISEEDMVTIDNNLESVEEVESKESYMTNFSDEINTFESEENTYCQTFGDAIINYGKNHSGGKKAGWIGNNEGFVVFTIPREVEGLYRLFIHYETGEQRPMDLQINDHEVYNLDFPRLRAWGMVGVYEVDVWLEAGNNTLKFYHETSYCPDIDLISFELDQHVDPIESEISDKENVDYVEREIVTLTILDNSDSPLEINDSYSFSNVVVDVSERYLIDFYYKTESTVATNLYVNENYQMINLPKSDDDKVSRLTTMIYLEEGTNDIKFEINNDVSIKLEKVEVTNLPAPATTWGVDIKEREIIPNNPKVPIYPWYPDGHISVLPDGFGSYMMYWAEYENYRTIGDTQRPEDHYTLEPATPIFGERGDWDDFDNGGSWLMSVHRPSEEYLIGFYHAEDHWYPHDANDIAWKSIGVTYSYDNGVTWVKGEQIITSSTKKPEIPEWGGAGDCTVIWDDVEKRWVSFYQENSLRVAVSYDELGAPGSWLKYYNNDFNEEGLMGEDSPVGGLELVPGGNPSVIFNSYLNKWVIVWHGWDPAYIYMSVSDDLIVWEEPIKIASAKNEYRRAWYPTIIGDTDTYAGRTAILYYADIAADFSSREFVAQEIVFLRNEEVD